MDARCSKLRFGKQMLISRNAKSGWRRQCMNSEIGWIAYAHICLATCISCAQPDLVNVCFGRGLWVLLVKNVHYRKLFINDRAHQPLLTVERLITVTFLLNIWFLIWHILQLILHRMLYLTCLWCKDFDLVIQAYYTIIEVAKKHGLQTCNGTIMNEERTICYQVCHQNVIG